MSVETSRTSKVSSDGGTLTGNTTPGPVGPKAVTIFDEPEHIPSDQTRIPSPRPSPKTQRPSISHKASVGGKKMTGRPAPPAHNQSSPSLSRNVSYLKLEDVPPMESISPAEHPTSRDEAKKLLSAVQTWLNEEKSKREMSQNGQHKDARQNESNESVSSHTDLNQDLALEKLEVILARFGTNLTSASSIDLKPRKSYSSNSIRRTSIAKAFKRTTPLPGSSDTEWGGDDINVPHVEASLDNTKTLAFTGGAVDVDDVEASQQKDVKYWIQFKQDIVRLTHTLKIRGWRKIPIEKGEVISVERLSGALTNAVYVVKPPKELPEPEQSSDTKPYVSKSRPKELLLRIYGPQVEHLIDRETELNILRRLARKRIGPRLLGYFTNGRFEEYLHAITLTAEDLHVPEIAVQIAKRMRELHDGVELLSSESHGGPKTFNNWDSWVTRCETVISWLDLQVKREAQGHPPPSTRYTRRGFVCGVEWPVFKRAYEAYRKMLSKEYGGKKAVQHRLVFAHNDTQSGNLMRLEPPGDSPLLQPANQHRQLVVIDFEYAGANTPGFEFANHFTEWCYNYHDAEKSWACNTNRYPSRQEQIKFIRSYLMHRPPFMPQPSGTPKLDGREKTNISDFMLDARTPSGGPGADYDKEERAREEQLEEDTEFLLRETRLWRIACAAQWVAWGIVQAKVPELDDPPKKSKTARVAAAFDRVRDHIHPRSDPLDNDVKALQEASKHDRPESRAKEEANREGDVVEGSEEEEDVEEFDCLAYSHDRAMLFWGDCLQMGIVKKSDLPESLLQQIKIVDC